MNCRISKRLSIVVLALTLFIPSYAISKEKMKGPKLSAKSMELKLTLRDLWITHIFWVRNVVIETNYGDANAVAVAEGKVAENARTLAESMTPYYGIETSAKLFGLIKGNYGASKDYMKATFSDNSEAKDGAADKMKKNAEDIVDFLSSTNPSWSKETLKSALLAHADHQIAQVNAVNRKDFPTEAKTWDAMKGNIYIISDILADGIAKQFPKKF